MEGSVSAAPDALTRSTDESQEEQLDDGDILEGALDNYLGETPTIDKVTSALSLFLTYLNKTQR